MKLRSSRYTIVHQHTRTVKVPTGFDREESYIICNPQDFPSATIHGAIDVTSAGRTARKLSPVLNVPSTGCKRHVLSQGVTIPYTPDTPCILRRTLLRTIETNIFYVSHKEACTLDKGSRTETYSHRLPDTRRGVLVDRRTWHHNAFLLRLCANGGAYRAHPLTPMNGEALNTTHAHTIQKEKIKPSRNRTPSATMAWKMSPTMCPGVQYSYTA